MSGLEEYVKAGKALGESVGALGIARDVGSGVQDNNFTVTGARQLGDDINPKQLIDLCLSENSRRMSRYDPRLLRPRAVPALAGLVRRFLR